MRERGNFDSYYPAHASYPMRIHGENDLPTRVHQGHPDENIAGLDIWDNDERTPLEAWRAWFEAAGAGWDDVECVMCELGRACDKSPRCAGVCAACGCADCECPQ